VLKRNLRVLIWVMELRCLGLGIRRDKITRMRNVKVTNNVRNNVQHVISDGFRSSTLKCLNFSITVFEDEWMNELKSENSNWKRISIKLVYFRVLYSLLKVISFHSIINMHGPIEINFFLLLKWSSFNSS